MTVQIVYHPIAEHMHILFIYLPCQLFSESTSNHRHTAHTLKSYITWLSNIARLTYLPYLDYCQKELLEITMSDIIPALIERRFRVVSGYQRSNIRGFVLLWCIQKETVGTRDPQPAADPIFRLAHTSAKSPWLVRALVIGQAIKLCIDNKIYFIP